MSQSNLLIRNVMVTYGRMILTVGLGLYGTRLMYLALSDVDIGIFNVLGASVALVEVIRASLTASAMRHLSFSLGQKDDALYASTANTMYAIFVLLGLAIWIVGWLCTPLLQFLTIPDDRRAVAFWVYQLTLFNVVRTTVMAPINAVLVSHQAMTTLAILTIPNSILMVVTTSLLFVLPGDPLFNFVVLLTLGQTIIALAMAVVCFARFPVSLPRMHLCDRTMVPHLTRFASWTALAELGWVLRSKGSSLLLNLYFGTPVNAGWDAANRAAAYHSNLTGAVSNSVAPALISSVGGNRTDVALKLMLSGSKFATLISLFLAVPLLMDLENILTLWLRQLPPYAAVFTACLVITMSIGALGRSFTAAMQGVDRIDDLVKRFSGLTLLILPLGLLAFAMGGGPEWIGYFTVLVSLVNTLLQAAYVMWVLESTARRWFFEVVCRTLPVLIIALAAAACPRLLMDSGWARAISVFACSTIAIGLTSYFCGITAEERIRIANLYRSIRHRRPRPEPQ